MTYTIYELLCFFVIYSVLGWCLEVCFCTINTGQFVNRGFLNGPVCPIYGFGMVIVLVALTPLAKTPTRRPAPRRAATPPLPAMWRSPWS